jgi:hypothetical protein
MTARTKFPGLKADGDSPERLALVVNQLLLGKMNCTLAVTLTASAASTTIEDPRINSTSLFIFDPRTAHAATELYGATMYVSAISKGSVTITHANSEQDDRTFAVGILA